jgi:hypothetical protein
VFRSVAEFYRNDSGEGSSSRLGKKRKARFGVTEIDRSTSANSPSHCLAACPSESLPVQAVWTSWS